jgi:small subunit ribosomal protein S13
MLFLFDTKVSELKRVDLVLQECYGIGLVQGFRIFVKLGFNKKTKMKHLNVKIFKQIDNRILQLVRYIFFLRVEADYRTFLHNSLKQIKNLRNFKSLRHFFKLPVNGQRTKNNACTQKKRRFNWKRVPIAKKKK